MPIKANRLVPGEARVKKQLRGMTMPNLRKALQYNRQTLKVTKSTAERASTREVQGRILAEVRGRFKKAKATRKTARKAK